MKDLKISTGEPFRAKVLGYSYTHMNKVVQRNTTLYPINEKVFLIDYQKDERGHKDNDLFAFVILVEGVYIEMESYSRSYLDRTPEIVERGNYIASNYINEVNELVNNKAHIQLLYIRVFEELGLNTAPLWAVREERKKIQDAKDAQKAEERKALELQAEEREKARLMQVKQQFLNKEYISSDDFLMLCKNDGVDIPIQTKGTLNRSVTTLSIEKSINYRYKKGGKHPSLTGCYKAISDYKDFLTSQQ